MSGMTQSDWKADRALFGRKAWLVRPAIWAVAVYRFGRWALIAPKPVRLPAKAFYFVAYGLVRLATGIDIPRGAVFGPGLVIHHFGGIVIHPEARVGARCVMRQGVTIGSRKEGGNPPVLGDDLLIGAYAQILGDIKVGNAVRIGALTLVMEDVPDGATVVGNPARVILRREGLV